MIKVHKKIGYSELIAVAALVISVFAVWFSYESRQHSIKISGIELQPEIKVNAFLNKSKFKKLHVIVYNNGPVEALQLVVKFVSHRYFEALKGIRVSGTGSETTYIETKLPPLKSIAFEIPEHFLYVNAMLQEPKVHNILELRVTYRRPPDFKQFSESAFYFVNPEGLWVSENSTSLRSEQYEALKEAAFAMLNKNVSADLGWDPLHQVSIEN